MNAPTRSPVVYSLSVHAAYACRHAGACCTAGWSIPVEQPVQLLLGTDLLTPEADGGCRFYDRASRLCSVHRDRGHAALPLACRQFPRRALVDARGVHVTLSHFCPTAAAMLLDPDVPLAIVAGPPSFPPAAIEDALDARDAWPPLVAPRLLFDLDAYARWESFLVASFVDAGCAEDSLARIATVAEALRRWTPARGTLGAYLEACIEAAPNSSPRELDRYAAFSGEAGRQLVLEATPEELGRRVDTIVDAAGAGDFVARRYLAAKAFASWTAYQARGVRTLVAELVLSLAVLRVEGVRGADWLLMHAADRAALLEALDAVEEAA